LNLGTAKVCGCKEPALQGVVTISITIINICDHIRKTAPTFCLPDGEPSASENHGTGPCGDGTVNAGEECDPNATPNGCPAGKGCQSCRCVGTGACDQKQGAAQGSTSDTRDIELGRTSGTFTFDYRAFTNKDHFIVTYEGSTLLDTGCVSTSDPNNDATGPAVSETRSYSGSSTKITVQVMANCETVSPNNAWDYLVHCPS